MTSFVGCDIKYYSIGVRASLEARIRAEQNTKYTREREELSKHHTFANGINKSLLPLSCRKDGTMKNSPLRNITNYQ